MRVILAKLKGQKLKKFLIHANHDCASMFPFRTFHPNWQLIICSWVLLTVQGANGSTHFYQEKVLSKALTILTWIIFEIDSNQLKIGSKKILNPSNFKNFLLDNVNLFKSLPPP